jgi:hypothetical protein
MNIPNIVPKVEKVDGIFHIVADEEKPVFDFDDVSWADEKAVSLARSQLRNAESLEQTVSAFGGMEIYMSKCVVSIPRSWLVKSAPAEIDWSDPQSFNYVKGVLFQDLMKALNEAQAELQKK